MKYKLKLILFILYGWFPLTGHPQDYLYCNDDYSIVVADKPMIIDLITSSEIAMKLAEIYIERIYGFKTAIEQKPYKVWNKGNEWVIEGASIHHKKHGGVFSIVISKKNGRVISVSHGE
ncbi:NTF2 fold immunity protein [Salmonella enterica]|uniref:NTF2 fold domain-containing protein n=1 Tax=Salmonella enterica subsp. salamae TaxID=59202 RepID=A0A6D2G678_SALER|nr:NTF2 fold immunity protein [Salmonella enterica]EAA5902652.1 hypothetical protein [Salmonella enterica subsp. enterica]ECF6031802.1 hypothetical protein [Salmonella enterica subsp. salamae serovar Greenside]EDW0465582.1 hypothetical protein [Salmonella enterica subsp. enterica serovar Victoria]EKR2076668.1 hypothetical protein [Salmonella enterica subsp. salamae serovar 9,46:l,w:e,n,x]HCA3405261.1 hypothetical protein [Salmonella enterica subsp. salamae serovar 35:g,m,s,t:-]HCM1963222.1 hy